MRSRRTCGRAWRSTRSPSRTGPGRIAGNANTDIAPTALVLTHFEHGLIS